MKNDDYFVGGQFLVETVINTEGFDMNTDPWSCTVTKGSKYIEYDRTHNTYHDVEEDKWYIIVDSEVLGSGMYCLITDIDIPDIRIDKGFRHETYMQDLFVVKAVKRPNKN